MLAAYAIQRLRFRGSNWLGLAIYLAYLVPPSILFIPLAIMVFNLGLYDSPLALILTYPTFLIPFCTWLLIGYFKSIPYELEECALIDGATRLQILWKITLPLAVPGLISAGIFAFTLSWNEFIYALAFIQSAENKTVPVAVLTQLVEGDVYHWGSLMAGALLGSIPVAIVLQLLRRALCQQPDRGGEGVAGRHDPGEPCPRLQASLKAEAERAAKRECMRAQPVHQRRGGGKARGFAYGRLICASGRRGRIGRGHGDPGELRRRRAAAGGRRAGRAGGRTRAL